MPLPTQTGSVALGSDLERRTWTKKKLAQDKAKSFFLAYVGKGSDSMITYEDLKSKVSGNTVVFDMTGKLEMSSIPDGETAEGKGVQKQKFSDSVTFSRYRFVVDNGDKFDGKNIGDLTINEHSDSISKLNDQWVRAKDQGIWDVLQMQAQFGYVLSSEQGAGKEDTQFGINALRNIEMGTKLGYGYDVSPKHVGKRVPFKPFRTESGEPLYVLFCDILAKNRFLGDPQSIEILKVGDVRGNNNRLLSGVIGKIGNFLIVEAPVFAGVDDRPPMKMGPDGKFEYADFGAAKLYTSGMRTYIVEGTDAATAKAHINADGTINYTKVHWQGSAKYEELFAKGQGHLYSRCVIAGANALQFAVGKDPDYGFVQYDFNRTSESMLEVWVGCKAAQIKAENKDYESVTIAGYNFGMVFVDVRVAGPGIAKVRADEHGRARSMLVDVDINELVSNTASAAVKGVLDAQGNVAKTQKPAKQEPEVKTPEETK